MSHIVFEPETNPEQAIAPRLLHGTRTIEVTWGDCDAAGVVFYPRFYAWFDACTHALLTSVGLDHHTLRRDRGLEGTPLVKASATFLSPATFGDVLVAESHIARLSARTFTVHHRLSLGDRVVVEGEEVRVWVQATDAASKDTTPKRFQPVDPGPEIRALLEGK